MDAHPPGISASPVLQAFRAGTAGRGGAGQRTRRSGWKGTWIAAGDHKTAGGGRRAQAGRPLCCEWEGELVSHRLASSRGFVSPPRWLHSARFLPSHACPVSVTPLGVHPSPPLALLSGSPHGPCTGPVGGSFWWCTQLFSPHHPGGLVSPQGPRLSRELTGGPWATAATCQEPQLDQGWGREEGVVPGPTPSPALGSTCPSSMQPPSHDWVMVPKLSPLSETQGCARRPPAL